MAHRAPGRRHRGRRRQAPRPRLPTAAAGLAEGQDPNSAEAVVGGVLGPLNTPVALVLGRRDEAGRLRVAGRTGPLPRDARPALGALLRTADQRHPWPPALPPARFGDAAPVEYTRVEPTVVVELAVDAAVDMVRRRPVWRHPATFRRVRHDLQVDDL